MSGGGQTTQVQSSEPWPGQIPWLHHVYNTAGALPQQQVYPGHLTAGVNPEMAQGWSAQANLARNPLATQAATGEAQRTLGGTYLYNNPGADPLYEVWSGQGQYQTGYNNLANIASGAMGAGSQQFQDALQSAWNRARPNVQSTFAGAGRFGGGLARAAEAREFGDIFSGMLNQDLNRRLAASSQMGGYEQSILNRRLEAAKGIQDAYQDERMNQMRALGLAPGVQGMGYTDAQQLLAAGYGQNQYQQDAINREMARWQQAQQAPYQRLAAVSGAIHGTGSPGSTVSVTGPSERGMRPAQIGLGALTGLGGLLTGFGSLGLF